MKLVQAILDSLALCHLHMRPRTKQTLTEPRSDKSPLSQKQQRRTREKRVRREKKGKDRRISDQTKKVEEEEEDDDHEEPAAGAAATTPLSAKSPPAPPNLPKQKQINHTNSFYVVFLLLSLCLLLALFSRIGM